MGSIAFTKRLPGPKLCEPPRDMGGFDGRLISRIKTDVAADEFGVLSA
jgi:hypothetical protein